MNDKIEELRWVRAFSPDLIPKYLIEQVRDRDYTVDNFYKYQNLNCLIEGKNGPTLNPFNHLYVLANDGNMVKGFLWFIVDPLSTDVIINTFSMDKEYWGNGSAVKKLSAHVKEILKKLKLKKVYWLTNYPKHAERNGFKRSKSILFEYNDSSEEEKKDVQMHKLLSGKTQERVSSKEEQSKTSSESMYSL